MKINLLELFGGIGAPRMALQKLGVDVKSIDYVEIDPNAVKAYNAIFDNNYKEQDINEFNNEIDILVHGSPCQDFSMAGKRNIHTERSIFYQKTLDIIEHYLNPRPKVIIWENVKSLLSKDNKVHFVHYLNILEKLGYKSYYGVLNALDFGIPQNRGRVFTISIRNDLKVRFDFNKLERKPMRPLIEFLEDVDSGKYDVKQPSSLKALEKGKIKVACNYVNTITTKQIRWNNGGIIFKEYKNFYIFPKKTDNKLINGNYNRVWKKDKIIGTLTVKDIKKIGFVNNDKELQFRYLTERECFRLMGFSDTDFDKCKNINLSSTTLYKLAGNSIVVDCLEAIFKELLNIIDFSKETKKIYFDYLEPIKLF